MLGFRIAALVVELRIMYAIRSYYVRKLTAVAALSAVTLIGGVQADVGLGGQPHREQLRQRPGSAPGPPALVV